MYRSTPEQAKRRRSSNKRALRKQARSTRRQIADEARLERDLEIQMKVTKHPWFVNASQVLLYEAFDGEVATQQIADHAQTSGKIVAYSRVTETPRLLEFIRPTSWSFTERGLPVPQGLPCPIAADALIIVPGVLFDLRGYRLGMGGGYYDTLLSNESALSMGLAYEAQVVAEVPVAVWDQPIGCLVTESSTYHFSDLEQEKWTGSKRLLGSLVV